MCELDTSKNVIMNRYIIGVLHRILRHKLKLYCLVSDIWCVIVGWEKPSFADLRSNDRVL